MGLCDIASYFFKFYKKCIFHFFDCSLLKISKWDYEKCQNSRLSKFKNNGFFKLFEKKFLFSKSPMHCNVQFPITKYFIQQWMSHYLEHKNVTHYTTLALSPKYKQESHFFSLLNMKVCWTIFVQLRKIQAARLTLFIFPRNRDSSSDTWEWSMAFIAGSRIICLRSIKAWVSHGDAFAGFTFIRRDLICI